MIADKIYKLEKFITKCPFSLAAESSGLINKLADTIGHTILTSEWDYYNSTSIKSPKFP